MKHTEILVFLQPEQLQEKVAGIFDREREKILFQFPDLDVQNIGSSAIPGAIGKFDVDLQIRVPQGEFDDVVSWMKANAEIKNPDYWTDQYALFKDKDDVIDYNVTVIGSKHDIFYRIRDYLIDNPDVLQKYAELKMSYQGKTYGEYRNARHEFFKRIKALLS